MKYCIAVKDKELFKNYLYEEHEYWSFAAFEDKDKEDIYGLLLQQFHKDNPQYAAGDKILKWFYASAVDENGIVYIINYTDGSYSEYGIMPLSRFRKAVLLQNAERKRYALKAKEIKENYVENTIVRKSSFMPSYKKFSYFDTVEGIELPFRFKECKGKGKKPLLVYLHGAGASGEDNFKQLAEFRTVGINLKEDCFVLLPQCGNFTENNPSTINVYTRSIRSLIENLAKSYPVDSDRIYVTGISYGGACVWYSLYNNPGFYAAAVPLMGYFLDTDADEFKPDIFKNERIWAGHAIDDKVVSANEDMALYKILKDVCDIKLDIYARGGHKMMKVFYRRDDWQKWMFSQKRGENKKN